MATAVLSSPRLRRRALWLGSIAAAAGLLAALAVLVPSHSSAIDEHTPLTNAPPQVGTVPRTVHPPRAELNALLDRFVPAVLARRDLAAGWELVTPDARGTRAQWLRGETPFQQYAAKPGKYHGWRVNYSYPGDVGFDIFLAPAKPTMVSFAFRGEAKRVGGHWRIAVFYPQASFQLAGRKQFVYADTDLQPQAAGAASTTARLSAYWLLAPGLALAALLAGAGGIVAVKAARRSARVKQIERELALTRQS